ncbi:MAG: FlgD immunoglobulin-like domain containing protein, partial [bacterium]
GDEVVAAFALSIYPNPFNPQTEISCAVPRACDAEVRIFDVRGQLIRRLPLGQVQPGVHRVTWRGRDEAGQSVASGVFFSVLYADGRNVGQIRKMSLVR